MGDVLYTSQWNTSIKKSLARLEPSDQDQVRQVTDAQSIKGFLAKLLQTQASLSTKHSASVVSHSLDPLIVFNDIFAKSCGDDLNTSVLAAQLPNGDGFTRFSEMVKRLAQRIKLFNECSRGSGDPTNLQEIPLDVNVELIGFLAESVRFYRRDAPSVMDWGTSIEDDCTSQAVNRLSKAYNKAQQNIDSAYQYICQLTQLIKRNAQLDEMRGQQKLLSLPTDSVQNIRLPCIMLPPAKNSRFYNRDGITERIRDYFHKPLINSQSRSLLLYGLGGIGKSHVALKYAHSQIRDQAVDVVLWLHSETDMALSQSFTDAALALDLPQSRPDRPTENRIFVLHWLQTTECRWLLIYDNAENAEILLPYWPQACKKGSILLTSRNHNLKFDPADEGIEVPAFLGDSGSKFLLHLLRLDIIKDVSQSDAKSALELAQQVEGHAQAITVMAGLIQTRLWGIEEFLSIYERNKDCIQGHDRRDALATIWELSFKSLEAASATLLGCLSYFNPDHVPQILFTNAPLGSLPTLLQKCQEELKFHNIVVPLLTLALIKRDKDTKAYSTHRLVQIQYRYYLQTDGRQTAFDQAVRILDEGLGQVKNQVYDQWTHCQLYMQQISSLKNNYKKERHGPDRLIPTLQFCSLLASSSRYLVETADYAELEDFMSVALESLDEISEEEKLKGISVRCRILSATALLWGHRGFFHLAIPYLEQCIKLHLEQQDVDLNALSWVQVNLGNVLTSACKFQDGLDWELKALETRKKLKDDDTIKPNSVVAQNIGRCYAFLSRWDEANELLEDVTQEFRQSKNWAMLVFTIFVQGTVYRRQGKLKESMKAYETAQSIWVSEGKLQTHHFNGACLYKLGCLHSDLGDIETAMDYLRKALVIVTLKKDMMRGDYARVLHKMSTLLKQMPGCEVESAEKAAAASRIVHEILNKMEASKSTKEGSASAAELSGKVAEMTLTEAGEEEYDNLVYVLWR